MQPTFCFIDDAEFELDNFASHIAPAFKGVEFIYARDFERAQRKLEGRRCLCFLLDIYGAEPGSEPGELPSPEELAGPLGQGFEVQSLYEGLEGEGWERANQFLRRVHARTSAAQDAFARAAGQIGQGPSFGLEALAAVRQHCPEATALGYSRKGTLADAAAMLRAGAHGVLLKPQGDGEEAIAQASQEKAPELARAAIQQVNHHLDCQTSALGMRLCQEGVGLPLVDALHLSLEQINGTASDNGKNGRREALERLKALRLEEMELGEKDKQVILALWDWLSLET
ncbi:MAG: hypothetical protein K9K66_02150 [Desulfarculaceae bacterium]|nr:hypothetical protein [Desulfarculaceae bacterium]MCF8073416.1 hypothetical protein [Desulfarculaceae bacterium]MCF8100437.1 hypothetical protein [Desulfarculaceae bacterium]MCF8115827.1 hypothetical protein [Desulfarculaceae bacterium]